MSLKPVDKAAYATVRTFLAAAAAMWNAWASNGGGVFPTGGSPTPAQIQDTIFGYIPKMAIIYNGQFGDDNCPSETERDTGAACFALRYDVAFSPQNIQSMIKALDARTDPAIVAEFKAAGATDDSDLEWWAVALTAGALIAIGGLPFAGAVVAKIAGYLLAAWSAYGFFTPKTPGGKSLAEKYAGAVSGGLEAIVKGASNLLLGVVAAAAAYFLLFRD